MPFNLLLANRTILLCFFFYFVLFLIIFFITLVVTENAKLRLALAITTGAAITVANYAIESLPIVTYKTIKDLSK